MLRRTELSPIFWNVYLCVGFGFGVGVGVGVCVGVCVAGVRPVIFHRSHLARDPMLLILVMGAPGFTR